MNLMKLSITRIYFPFKISNAFRNISLTASLLEDETEQVAEKTPEKYSADDLRRPFAKMPYKPVDIATSIDYLKSREYYSVYIDKPVWFYYRRNFCGQYPPKHQRKNCVFAGYIKSSNACPICRDNHLVLSYKHLELMKQFIDPLSGEALSSSVTHLCQKQHSNLIFNLDIAHQLGLLEKAIPIRLYDYEEYYSKLPDGLDLVSVTNNSTMEILPNAARIFAATDDTVEITRPRVQSRYSTEHRDYLEARAKKLAELKSAKLKLK